MVYIWAIALLIVNAGSLALTLLTLPGNWLMLGATIFVAWWWRDVGMFSPWTLVACAVLAILGEIIEFVSSAVGVNRVGGTKSASLGSLIGSVIGGIAGQIFIPLPILGALIGLVAGAAGGALIFELSGGGEWSFSARSALAAGLGRLVGTAGKFAVGLAMWVILAVAAFWP